MENFKSCMVWGDALSKLEAFLVIFQKRVRVFHRGFKHEKTDAFIVFECLKPR